MSQDFSKPSAPWPDSEGPVRFDPVDESRRSGHGCFFYGCITALVLLVFVSVAGFLAFRYIRGKFREAVAMYTADAPKKMPALDVPEEERAAIIKRADEFEKAVRTHPDPSHPQTLTDEQRTLVLTSDDLNVLVERNPELRGKFHVSIVGDRIKTEVSLPLNELPGLQGRYLNGEASVELSVTDGRPIVRLRDIRVKGQPLPDGLRQAMEQADFGSKDGKPDGEPVGPPLAHKLEKIEIKDGKLTIIARKEPEMPVGPTTATKVEPIVIWKTEDGGNGHSYELVRESKSWTEADADARKRIHNGMKAHLATIADEAENSFLRDRIADGQVAWIGLTDAPKLAAKPEDDAAPKDSAGGWKWVTGEPLAFTAWTEGEPKKGDPEKTKHYGEFDGEAGPHRGQWATRTDEPDGGRFYIIEYEPAPPGRK